MRALGVKKYPSGVASKLVCLSPKMESVAPMTMPPPSAASASGWT